MKRRHRLQNHLLQEADTILRAGGSAILTRNAGRGGNCRGVIKGQARARVDAKRAQTEATFRAMPKVHRKVLTERFKAQNKAGLVRQSWLYWLTYELENDHGLSLQ